MTPIARELARVARLLATASLAQEALGQLGADPITDEEQVLLATARNALGPVLRRLGLRHAVLEQREISARELPPLARAMPRRPGVGPLFGALTGRQGLRGGG